jgi:ABC-type nitrate/sulfonate/bicarbonate transport system permease component
MATSPSTSVWSGEGRGNVATIGSVSERPRRRSLAARLALSPRLWQGALALGVFLAVWHTASVTGMFGRMRPDYARLLLPSPGMVFCSLAEVTASGYLWVHASVSVVRVAAGFTLAVLIGVSLGLAMAVSPTVDHLMAPFVKFLSPIPGLAWVPLAILWFGLGNKAAIFVITFGAVFPIIFNTIQGVHDIDHRLVDAARVMGAKGWQVLYRVMLPSVTPSLVTGCRAGLANAWRVVLAAEMVGVPKGVGYMLAMGRGTGETEITMVIIVVLGSLMLVIDELVFTSLDRHTGFWRSSASAR